MSRIHSSAVVDSRAELAGDVEIGPGAVIGPQVKIDSGTVVGPHVVIDGDVTIGRDNRIFAHAVLGTPPQDLKYRNEPTRLVLGDANLIREFVTIHRGTPHGGGVTRIGSHVFLMAYVHVAHDNQLGDHVVVANSVQVAGHVEIAEHAVIGGCSAIHQFVRVGAHAFVGGGSVVVMDVPPFCKAAGNRARLIGLNGTGLRRRGFPVDQVRLLRRSYRLAFQSELLVAEAADLIAEQILPRCPPAALLVDFLRQPSQRGITH